jgi:sugar phosphate isomerase/epimerase
MQQRRDFLRTSVAALAATAIPWRAPTMAGDKLEQIGIQLYTVRSLMDRNFDDTLTRIARIGYKEVEFAGYFGRTPEEVRSILTRLGLDAPAGHMPYEALNDDRSWAGILDQANRIGHRYVVIAWTPQEARRTLEDWKRVARKFNWAGQKAKEAGLVFAYHNHDFEFKTQGSDVIPFDLLLAETDPALVKIEMDLYWITLAGSDPEKYFRLYPGRFPMVHVKDMKKDAPLPLMVDVGQGDIDFRPIFRQRDQAGIRHFFVEHDEPREAISSAETSYRYLKALEF